MTKRVKVRALLAGGLFTLFFVILIGKLYWIQVVNADVLLKKAQDMWEKTNVIEPVRGAIVDRNFNVLAEDGPSYTVVVNPQIIHKYNKENEIASGLSSILGKPLSETLEAVTRKKEDGTLYTWVEVRNEGWKIDVETADKIAAYFGLEKPLDNRNNLYKYGIYLQESSKRYYPANSLAAHVIGYYDKNGQAVMGIEAQFDDMLRGKPGRIVTEKDRKGYELPDAKVTYEPAVNGYELQLTIDRQIQSYIETALEKAYNHWRPKSMTAIAVDPKTMEILGMANYPTFNPQKYWETGVESFYNHAIGSVYEPGSTFKLVTLAGAVEEGLFDPNETYQSGSISVPGETLHDHNRTGWGKITYLEGLKRSSNVAFVKLGYEKLKADKFKHYIEAFGFGVKTGIDLPGEAKGTIRLRWPAEIAAATYGQGGVLTTPIQQIAAYAAIANGGKLMRPLLVKAIIDPKTGKPVQTFEPEMVRQVVSEATAKQVTAYLEQVVSDQEIGTGRKAYIEGYRVAGKTGTANIVIDGKYAEDKWMVSFIGFAPADNPKIAVLVMADQPELNGNYQLGGEVAPPVFKEIVSQSLRYMGVAPAANSSEEPPASKEQRVAIPDVTGASVADAKKKLNERKINFDVIGKGSNVIAQFPFAGTEIGPTQRIYLLTEQSETSELPDLRGKSLRDALEICALLKVACTVTGEGYVVDQKIATDGNGKVVVLQLQPWHEMPETSAPKGTSAQPATRDNGGAGAGGGKSGASGVAGKGKNQ